LLDLIFGHTGELAGEIIDYSQRRENRVRLRRSLLRELWSEKVMEGEGRQGVNLRIPDAVRQLMEQRMILVEDLRQVIEWAESSGNKLVNRESGHALAHFRPGTVTYWVEYSVDQDGFTIHNCYSHRMEIVEELKP
jgi:glutamate synthase (NADPH) small chain